MLCRESGNIRQREAYLPSLLCPYALQRKWKHQAKRRLSSFTSLSLCSAKKVETSVREKTTYLHFSVPMLCKESGNIRQREDYLASLLCPYALQRKGSIRQREDYLPLLLCPYALQIKWKHQSERRLPSFTSLSLRSAKKGKHQAERRLPTFTSLSLCSAKKVETSGREKTT